MDGKSDVIEHKAYARVGFLGNPSDVYYGKTISFSLANFCATVTLRPSDELTIQPHPVHDLVHFASLPQLVCAIQLSFLFLRRFETRFTLPCMNEHAGQQVELRGDNNIDLRDANFTLSYDTNIPRQAGLSGSSGIVCAALNCLLDFYQVRELIKVELRPNLILQAEKELGIVAGLQDRVAQVYGGLVYMDFSKENMDELGHGIYIPMDLSLLPSLYLIYAENPSDSGK
ncbi:Glucuronokinase 1, partial [Mucuna pruriens]